MKKNAHSFYNMLKLAAGIFSISLCACTKVEHGTFPVEVNKVNHVVVIYLENHSFDNLYGEFPGTNNLSNATPGQITQVDSNA